MRTEASSTRITWLIKSKDQCFSVHEDVKASTDAMKNFSFSLLLPFFPSPPLSSSLYVYLPMYLMVCKTNPKALHRGNVREKDNTGNQFILRRRNFMSRTSLRTDYDVTCQHTVICPAYLSSEKTHIMILLKTIFPILSPKKCIFFSFSPINQWLSEITLGSLPRPR